jgi:hypothetical protein
MVQRNVVGLISDSLKSEAYLYITLLTISPATNTKNIKGSICASKVKKFMISLVDSLCLGFLARLDS